MKDTVALLMVCFIALGCWCGWLMDRVIVNETNLKLIKIEIDRLREQLKEIKEETPE